MNKKHACMATVLMTLLVQTAATADMENGRALTGRNCTGCHDDSMYTRDERRVTTMSALQNQVQRCEINLDLKWFEDDINDVTGYLNTQYYHFESPQ